MIAQAKAEKQAKEEEKARAQAEREAKASADKLATAALKVFLIFNIASIYCSIVNNHQYVFDCW